MSRTDWAPLDAQLRALVARGLSTHQIAGEIGVSRSAVASRCRRLRLLLGRHRRGWPIGGPRWPPVAAAVGGETALSGQCFGGDPDPGDGGICRASRPATAVETASSLGGEL